MNKLLNILLLYTYEGYHKNVLDSMSLAAPAGTKFEVCNIHSKKIQASQISQYDVIFVDTCGDGMLDNVDMGNVLADFSCAGGALVVALFSNHLCHRNQQLAGAFEQDNFHPFQYTSSEYKMNTHYFLDLEKIPNKFHPILHNVKSFDGGSYSAHFNPLSLNDGAVAVAHWNDGSVLVAEKMNNMGTGMVVALNLVALSSQGSSSCWNTATDGHWIMYNSCEYAFKRSRRGRSSYSEKLLSMALKHVYSDVQINFS